MNTHTATKPTANYEIIDATLAEKYLEKNTDNRKNRKWWVNGLAAAMQREEWITTHQGIAFDVTGRLIDGQHRLEAIVLSKKSIELLVCRNLPTEAFSVLDAGMKRSIADQTKMHRQTAEVCRILSGVVYGRNNCTAAQAQSIYESGVGKIHDRLVAYCPSKKRNFSAAAIRATAVVMVLDGHDEKYIFDLYTNLVHQRFDQLPIIAHSFIRQLQTQKFIVNQHNEVYGRALKVFNIEYAKVERLGLTESEMDAALQYVKSVVNSHLGV